MTTAVHRAFLMMLILLAGSPAEAAPPLLNFLSPMRKASDLIGRQDPLRIYKENEGALTAENMRVEVSLTKQRVWLMGADKVFLDSPISSGKVAGMTPTGKFSVLEKDPNHKSSVYGNFVDPEGRIVKGGISLKIDSAPSGTHYLGAPMKWFMRLTDEGVGMHVGILPGYPASHGCVRLPEETARLMYSKVHTGTPVTISP